MIDSPKEWRVDMCQGCGCDAECRPLGSTLLSNEIREAMTPQRISTVIPTRLSATGLPRSLLSLGSGGPHLRLSDAVVAT
jgi:hypothetical protein